METNAFARTVNNMINQRLMDTHTNFIGKIVSLEFNIAKVQPLTMVKVYGEKAKTAAVLVNVPILLPYKYVYKVDEVTNELIGIEQQELNAGDTVYCGVCERDITEAKDGNLAAPSVGRRHNLSDSVLIMGLSKVEYVTAEEGE